MPRIQLRPILLRRSRHHRPSWPFLPLLPYVYTYISALLLLCSLNHQQTTFVLAFSSFSPGNSASGASSGNSFTLFDRFRSECPASVSCIRQFDPRLVVDKQQEEEQEDDEHVWVAVYRTFNNNPSVFVKDEFLNAMRLATGGIVTDNTSSSSSSSTSNTSQYFENTSTTTTTNNNKVTLQPSSSSTTTPVAVARLRPSDDFEKTCTWILDKMQCSLKKESQDEACEGGSEHKEALSVAIDALLLYHLQRTSQQQQNKDSYYRRTYHHAIRSKATLVGASLLEDRGFEPVQVLSKDMATHISSLDRGMAQYAQKYVETSTTKHLGARDRAHRILSQLGRLDRDAEVQAAKAIEAENAGDNDNDNEEEFDPFASIKQWGL